MRWCIAAGWWRRPAWASHRSGGCGRSPVGMRAVGWSRRWRRRWPVTTPALGPGMPSWSSTCRHRGGRLPDRPRGGRRWKSSGTCSCSWPWWRSGCWCSTCWPAGAETALTAAVPPWVATRAGEDRRRQVLQVVPEYERLSAVPGAGHAGRGRTSGPQYSGVATIRPGGLILVSDPAHTAMPTCGLPARCAPEAAQLCALSRPCPGSRPQPASTVRQTIAHPSGR
jgi:hypothetical protein